MELLLVIVTIFLMASSALSSKVGDLCQDNSDCTYSQQECIFRFAECTQKGCFCRPEYGGRFASFCRKDLDLSDRCNNRAASIGCPAMSFCDPVQDKCVQKIKAGSNCTDYGTFGCTPGAVCDQNNKCTCYEWYKELDGRCVAPDFGEPCTGICKSNYVCKGIPQTCQCAFFNDTKQTFMENGRYVTRCVNPQASQFGSHGGACRLLKTTHICQAGLTCSKCVGEDAATCFTADDSLILCEEIGYDRTICGADAVKVCLLLVTAALLLANMT